MANSPVKLPLFKEVELGANVRHEIVVFLTLLAELHQTRGAPSISLEPSTGSLALPGNPMNCRLCLLNCRLIDVFGRQSLQDSAFPGRSLGTSVFESIGEKYFF